MPYLLFSNKETQEERVLSMLENGDKLESIQSDCLAWGVSSLERYLVIMAKPHWVLSRTFVCGFLFCHRRHHRRRCDAKYASLAAPY